ncbi:uncharacterized protein LOC141850165 [Brevipalpus obovatus]|uniref:uncharacterized protein LOC141850165 n=1 Tax=Brevipalpus obovatus TaxID=246614 RepID=UPI003D9DF3C0
MAKENIIPAGYEDIPYYDRYMDDDDYDDEEDDLNSVVYPDQPPLKPLKFGNILSDEPVVDPVVDPVVINEQLNDEADKCEEEKSFLLDLKEELQTPKQDQEESTPITWTEIEPETVTETATETETVQYSFCTELEEFLTNLNLAKYSSFLEAKKITLPDLLLFSPEDFERSGLDYGVQLRLMEAISKRPGYRSYDLPLLTRKSQISCPTAIKMLKTVNKHLMFIDTDIRYLRNRLRDDPSMLEREDALGNKEDLITQIENASHYCTVLLQILADVDQRLKKSNVNESNHVEEEQSKSPIGQTFLLKVGGCVAIGSLVLSLVYRSSFIKSLSNF